MPLPRSPSFSPYPAPAGFDLTHCYWLRTGTPKKPNAETLEFTVNALDATRRKLDFYLTKVPSDALREARAEIASESGNI